jgi:hypothetical protein
MSDSRTPEWMKISSYDGIPKFDPDNKEMWLENFEIVCGHGDLNLLLDG